MRRFFYISGSLTSLALLIILLVRLGVFNERLAQMAVRSVNKNILGELKVEELEGSLFSHFQIKNIQVLQKDTLIFSLDTLEIEYNIWRLFRKEVSVQNITIHNVWLRLKQENDTLWNFQNLFLADENSTPKESSPSDWTVDVKKLEFKNAHANVTSIDPIEMIPTEIVLSSIMGLKMGHNDLEFDLHHLCLKAENPSFVISNMQGRATFKDSTLLWDSLVLKLKHSFIESHGVIPLNSLVESNIQLKATPFDFKDFHPWLASLYGEPMVDVRVNSENQVSQLCATIQAENQTIKISGSLFDFYDRPRYHLDLKTDSLNADYWFHRPDLSSNIHGSLEIRGQGFDVKKDSMFVCVDFKDLKYEHYELKHLLFNADKKGDKFHGLLDANTVFGKVTSEVNIEHIDKIPQYTADIQLEQINLAPLILNDKLKSTINLNILVNGEGYELGKAKANVKIKSQKSELFHQAITQFSTSLSVDMGQYKVHDFNLQTPYLEAYFSGGGNAYAEHQFFFDLQLHNIEKTVSLFGFYPFSMQGGVHGEISGSQEALQLSADVTVANFKSDTLAFKQGSVNIRSLFSLKPTGTSNFEPDAITQLILRNGFISAKGQAHQLLWGMYALDSIDVDVTKEKSEINGKAIIKTPFGSIMSEICLDQIFNVPRYHFSASVRHLDLSYIAHTPNLVSDLNLRVEANGQGYDPHELNTNIRFQGSESTLLNLPFNDFNAILSISRANYTLTGFKLETPYARLMAEGKGNLFLDNHLTLNAQIRDDDSIPFLFGQKDFRVTGDLYGEISGSMDSLYLLTTLNLEQIKMDSISLESLTAIGEIQLGDESYKGNMHLRLKNGRFENLKVLTADFQSHFDHEKADNFFTYEVSDSVYGKIRSVLSYKNDPTIFLPEIDLTYYERRWLGGGNQSYVLFGKDSIRINEVALASGASSIYANGTFSFQEKENLHLRIRNMNLSGFSDVPRLPYAVGGWAELAFDLTGTASEPELYGFVNIKDPSIDTLSFRNFFTEISYGDDIVSIQTYLNGHLGRLIDVEGMLPFHFSVMDKMYLPEIDLPVKAIIRIKDLDLAQLNAFIPVEDTKTGGLLNLRMSLSNTLNSPSINGVLNVKDGYVRHSPLGIDYHRIMLRSRMDSSIFRLDSLQILAGKGRLDMNGNFNMQSLDESLGSQLDFNLRGKNFKAFDSDMLRATVNTSLKMEGSVDEPVFEGQLTVLRSTLNTDLFIKRYNRVYDDSDIPLLVAAQEKIANRSFRNAMVSDAVKKVTPQFFKQLTGQFDVLVPRNTWIKGKNMNFELAGALKAIQKDEQVDVFGTMNVKRGYYKIYGKRLEFEEGEVTFTGGQSLDPVINFNIVYAFRDMEDALRNLRVMISGKSSNPSVKFYLDDTSLEEKDAISYLLFNKSINELNNSERSYVGSNMSVAKDIALGQVSSVIKNALQSSLGLDVIEISGKTGWTQGNVSIGKYITNNLFLSYERAFALDRRDKLIDPEKITLEYQIYRSLFIQATNQRSNSGFDFLFKRTWK